jgi:hypothetical protein
MRLPRDEGCWRSTEFASERGRKGNPESTARALDVARGRNDGDSVFCPTGGLVHLRREFRRSCNGSELCRRCFWRGCVSARTCNPSTLARSLAGCHRRRTGVFRQELTALDRRSQGAFPGHIFSIAGREAAAQFETFLNRDPRHDLLKNFVIRPHSLFGFKSYLFVVID